MNALAIMVYGLSEEDFFFIRFPLLCTKRCTRAKPKYDPRVETLGKG